MTQKQKLPRYVVDLTNRLSNQLLILQARAGAEIPAIAESGGLNPATAFIPLAHVEATTRYKSDHRRGLLLANETPVSPQTPGGISIWWVGFEANQAIVKDMLIKYRPDQEVIIVRCPAQTVEPIRVKAGGQADTPGIFPNDVVEWG